MPVARWIGAVIDGVRHPCPCCIHCHPPSSARTAALDQHPAPAIFIAPSRKPPSFYNIDQGDTPCRGRAIARPALPAPGYNARFPRFSRSRSHGSRTPERHRRKTRRPRRPRSRTTEVSLTTM
ncbi:hypothetical protein Tchl_2238 [Thauera chlorobenzoica]|uniref:Uncharacterized protein n=1 Tax=Thauera chlorobenzoica TaxID=96773 RepID=A0A1L6FDS9_9RHOO|nr:hypothetical protein Tchl_2238 [Thauera chlorobenzoica]